MRLNLYALLVATLPLLYILWIKTHPYDALKMLANLKRKHRKWVIKREGERSFKLLEKEMKNRAGKSRRKQKAVKVLLKQEKKRIVKKFGKFVANKWLGTPGPFEKDF